VKTVTTKVRENLTKREVEVLRLIAEGLSSQQIAEQLKRSEKTILAHRHAIGQKLGVSNRIELLRIALTQGLVPLPAPGSGDGVEYLDELRERANRGARSHHVLRTIDSSISNVTGHDFFPVLVKCLARCMDANCAYIVQCDEESPAPPAMLAKHCAACVRHNDMLCRDDVIIDFLHALPMRREDPLFDEEYPPHDGHVLIGVHLFDAKKTRIGMLAVLIPEPVDDALQVNTILRILASRASAELQRVRAETALIRVNAQLEQRVAARTAELSEALNALRENEARYRLIVENQRELIVQVDLDNRFTYVSPTYCEVFGKTEEELLGHTFFPLVHEDDREPTALAMEVLFTPPYRAYVEQRAMTRHGWRWFAWTDHAIVNGHDEVTSIIGVGRDITDHKRIEDALLDAQCADERLLNTVGEFMFITDEARIINANPQACRALGYAPDELCGMHVTSIDVEFDSMDKIQSVRKALLNHGTVSFQTRFKHNDGSTFPAQVTLRHMRTAQYNRVIALVRPLNIPD
jgi:PAS domain S-box-containing protein